MNGEELNFSYEFGPFRLEPATRRLLREGEPLPLTPKGVVWVDPLVTPDGRGYVYTYQRQLTDLYLVEGLQ
jgi:hypothetical protein